MRTFTGAVLLASYTITLCLFVSGGFFLANPVIVIFILFGFGSASGTSGFLELRG